jgi:dihydropteroate synthase
MLRLRDRTLVAPAGEPLIMGIVNASPESFSDGGLFDGLDALTARAEALAAAGATIIDVGGESGVTGVDPLAAEDEIRRVAPLVARLVGLGLVVSVDTWKAPVARAVLAEGAHLINDVSGLRDVELAVACARSGAGLVVMHTRAEPKRKEFPHYDDVVADVLTFLRDRMATALELGVAADGIVLDPGPDFGKTPAQTIAVLTHLDAVVAIGRPVLLAVSRKDFIGALTLRRPRERDAATLAAVADGVARGASIVRVHDVAAVRDYFTVRAALLGDRPVDPRLALPTELRRQPPD